MAQSKLSILLEAKNKASAELKKVSSDVDGLSKNARAAAIGIGAMGAAFAAAKAGQFAFDLARATEEGRYLQAAFKDMATGIGQNADTMLAAMRRASSGMVSDVELVRSANRAMLLGVADDANEMASLLEVASKRGRAMGLSTEQAFNDIVTGIGRMSPMILDNLGIVFDAEQVFSDYADRLGTTADLLSDVERKQALLNATVESTAGMAAPAVSEFEKMDAAIQNATASLGELFSPAAVSAAMSFAEAIATVEDALSGIVEANTKYGIGFEGVRNAYTDTSKAMRILENELQKAKQHFFDLDRQLGSIGGQNRIDEITAEMKRASAEVRTLQRQIRELEQAEKQLAQSGLNDHLRAATIGFGNMDEAARGAASGIGAYRTAIASVSAPMETMAYDYSKIRSHNIGLISGVWADKTDDVAKSTRGWSSAVNKLNEEFEGIKSKVQGVLSSVLGGETAGINADDLLPDPVRLDENARRLADIAVGGFKGQEWIGDFAADAPDIYQQLLDAADPKAAAAQLLKDFQDGMLNGTDVLIDKDAAKERVKRMILGEAGTAAIVDEIASELASEMGISFERAREAAGASLGMGSGMGGGAMGSALEGINGVNVGGEASKAIAAQFEAAAGILEMSAKRSGRSWGGWFLDTVAEGVPGELTRILAFQVTPIVEASLASNASRTASGEQ